VEEVRGRGGWNNGPGQDASNGQVSTVPSRCVAPVPVEWNGRPLVGPETVSEPPSPARVTPACETAVTVESSTTPSSDLASYPVPEEVLAIGWPTNGLGKATGMDITDEGLRNGRPVEFLENCSDQTGCTHARPGDPVGEEVDEKDSVINNGADQVDGEGVIPLRSSEAHALTEENFMETRGWLAPVHVNGALMMLAVDTGAAMTMINSRKFLEHLDRGILRPSGHTFHTAAGDTLPALGQFSARLLRWNWDP
jgi:hypothetical protein